MKPTALQVLMESLRESFRAAEALPEGSPEQQSVLGQATSLVGTYVCGEQERAVSRARAYRRWP